MTKDPVVPSRSLAESLLQQIQKQELWLNPGSCFAAGQYPAARPLVDSSRINSSGLCCISKTESKLSTAVLGKATLRGQWRMLNREVHQLPFVTWRTLCWLR